MSCAGKPVLTQRVVSLVGRDSVEPEGREARSGFPPKLDGVSLHQMKPCKREFYQLRAQLRPPRSVPA
jgi:hypothetical protein